LRPLRRRNAAVSSSCVAQIGERRLRRKRRRARRYAGKETAVRGYLPKLALTDCEIIMIKRAWHLCELAVSTQKRPSDCAGGWGRIVVLQPLWRYYHSFGPPCFCMGGSHLDRWVLTSYHIEGFACRVGTTSRVLRRYKEYWGENLC